MPRDRIRMGAEGVFLRGFGYSILFPARIARFVSNPQFGSHALTTATSSHRVVYCGVRLSCRMPQTRRWSAIPELATCTVPLPHRTFKPSSAAISSVRSWLGSG